MCELLIRRMVEVVMGLSKMCVRAIEVGGRWKSLGLYDGMLEIGLDVK